MAKLYLAALLFFLYCVSSSFFLVSCAGSLNFTFPPNTNIIPQNAAYFQEAKLQLTSNEVSGNLRYRFGWVTYDKYIPLWDNSTRALANFSTHFQFVIGRGNDQQYGFGDGLAFILAPFDLEQPVGAVGGWLGLFNATTYRESFYQMVAVEFDTYKNFWDPDDNHVGIDVKSIFSKVTVPLSNETREMRPPEFDLKNEANWDAWVDYDGGAKQLQVFLLYNPLGFVENVTKPESPILSFEIDLRDHLPENIKVGLSASTGASSETHTVTAWNFSSEYSWEISTPAPPPTNTSVGENPFIGSPPPANTSNGENLFIGSPKKKRNTNYVEVISISVIAGVLAVCGLEFAWWWYFRKNKGGGEGSEESDVELDECFAQGPRKFSYAELSTATRNFGEDQKLGQGGFGGVYSGILPGTNESVAVKRISQGSKQGRKEYVSEVTIISKLRHRNLVQLLGWCHRKRELLLVYEFLPNGSLDKYLFGEDKHHLDWKHRYSIACDIASALVYLHEEYHQRVVHRDVKASNVMLDSNFNAKLGDFGLARLMDRDQVASHTTVVAGTFGYLAPECVITGKAGPEADVYSFGAVSLEIACGRRPVDRTLDEHNCRLVEWVWDLHGQGKILDAADGKLEGNFNAGQLERLMLVGLMCSHPDPKTRPTMREVIKILKLEAALQYVPLDLPVAVYSRPHLSPYVTSSSATSTLMTLNSPGKCGVSLASISSAGNASVDSSSTASSSPGKISTPLLNQTGLH